MAKVTYTLKVYMVKSTVKLTPCKRVQHKFGRKLDESENGGRVWDDRNFNGRMQDENRMARPGYALFRRQDRN